MMLVNRYPVAAAFSSGELVVNSAVVERIKDLRMNEAGDVMIVFSLIHEKNDRKVKSNSHCN